MQPALAGQFDLDMVNSSGVASHVDEEILLRKTIETCLTHPHSKPVVILRELEHQVDERMLRELERELSVFDETMDLSQELEGARRQLQQVYVQKKEGVLLEQIRDKPLSTLTEDERTLLKSLGSKAGQKKA